MAVEANGTCDGLLTIVCAHTHTHTHTQTYMHACTHTHTDTHTHTHRYTHTQTYTHTHRCTHTQTYTHTHRYTHTQTHTCTDTQAHTHTQTHAHRHTHTHRRTHTQMHTDARTHTHTHTHTDAHTHRRTHTHTHRRTHTHRPAVGSVPTPLSSVVLCYLLINHFKCFLFQLVLLTEGCVVLTSSIPGLHLTGKQTSWSPVWSVHPEGGGRGWIRANQLQFQSDDIVIPAPPPVVCANYARLGLC